MADGRDMCGDGRLTPRYVSGPPSHRLDFTFATLVLNDERYERLRQSLEANGFDPSNSELIALDNRSGNRFDGYSYLRRVMIEAQGEYIVLTHDDVEFREDGIGALRKALADLTELDPNWAVAGNAGGTAGRDVVRHIDDPIADSSISAPRQVESLDENFMIVRRDRIVLHSLDLSGFHHYGADLCLQAGIQGAGKAYVIPFKLRHHSRGQKNADYYRSRSRFSDKYAAFFRNRRYSTTTGTFYIGGAGFVGTGRLLGERARGTARRIARRLRTSLLRHQP